MYRTACTVFVSILVAGFAFAQENAAKDESRDVQGIWVAVIGPDTPARGERAGAPACTQSQIAATIAALLGEDYHGAFPRTGLPIADLLDKSLPQ